MAAIAQTEQDGKETLDVVADHQVIRSAHGAIEVINRDKTKKPPGCGVSPDDFVDRAQRQMQELCFPGGG